MHYPWVCGFSFLHFCHGGRCARQYGGPRYPSACFFWVSSHNEGPLSAGTNCLCGDATIPDKQGAAWVGTAPCHMLQSLQQTTQAGLKPEFQKIHPSADGRMKAVITCSPDGQPQKSGNLQLTMARFGHSEKNHTKHWQSMYQTMICKAERL